MLKKSCFFLVGPFQFGFAKITKTNQTNKQNTLAEYMNYPIASVARPPGVEYLTKSLHRVIDSLDESELVEVVIVVALTDREKRLRDERGKILYRKFRSQVDSGLVIIVGPTSNIYPMTNFYALKRRPFNNTYVLITCFHES